MSIETIISTYGLPALAAGALTEESTFVIMAGFLAHEGYFPMLTVIAVASLAAFAGTEILFLFGRWQGADWLNRHPKKLPSIQRARHFMARNQTLVILGFRYIYGLHTIAPIMLGMSTVNARRFTWVNAAGALAWAVIFTLAGYGFGRALNALLADLRHLERHIMAAIAIAGASAWLIYRILQRRRGIPAAF